MKKAMWILTFWLVALTASSAQGKKNDKYEITCFSIKDDADGDGYAKKGAKKHKHSRSKKERYTCPVNYVMDVGDCDDDNQSVHPRRLEVAANGADDNCSGEADETEYIYFEKGNSNRDRTFRIRVKVNNKDVINRIQRRREIAYTLRYNRAEDLNEDPHETARKLIRGRRYSQKGIGEYHGFEITTPRLDRATVYEAQVRFYAGVDSGKRLSLYGKNSYWTTTTNSRSKTSKARTKIVLRGLNEYWLQYLGYVGKNGSKWPNGTRYSAGPNDWWCSEFYSWVTRDVLQGIERTSTVKALSKFFGKDYKRGIGNVKDMDHARRGDWLAMDTSEDGEKNHTGMLLAVRGDGKVITLEGNASNSVGIRTRDLDKIYGVGHVAKWRFPSRSGRRPSPKRGR